MLSGFAGHESGWMTWGLAWVSILCREVRERGWSGWWQGSSLAGRVSVGSLSLTRRVSVRDASLTLRVAVVVLKKNFAH